MMCIVYVTFYVHLYSKGAQNIYVEIGHTGTTPPLSHQVWQ